MNCIGPGVRGWLMRKIECRRCFKYFDADHFLIPGEMLCMFCDDARQNAIMNARRDAADMAAERKRTRGEDEN